jgi:MFS family permease
MDAERLPRASPAHGAASVRACERNPAVTQPPPMPRAVRGLLLGLTLSGVNLLGTFLALLTLGGLGAWSGWQFVGFFGMVETATGIAFIFGPNLWRLPVAEATTSDRTAVRLAASTLVLPHWAAGTKALGGLAMVVYAGFQSGVGPATLGLPVLVGLIAVGVLALSAAVARFGVARPELDVFHIVIERPERAPLALPGISIGALLIQLVINVGAFPAVKLLPPAVFYRPEIGPAPGLLLACAAAALLATGVAALAWRGRIAWRAPREQQREAEQAA